MRRIAIVHDLFGRCFLVLFLIVFLSLSCSTRLFQGRDSWPGPAEFGGHPTSGKAPLEVQFGDLSTALIIQWDWAFPGGTPDKSKEIEPTVIYNKPGEYDVSLTVLYHVPDDSVPRQETELKKKYIEVTSE
ncbi:MAG: PKD domain-containing protein [Gemmatimonadota bacterium]|nr:MAG: PKD domain-containing protein [Gemmatimonadota bacterium]